MAIMLPLGRAVTRQLPRTNHALTRLALSNPLLHASCCPQEHHSAVTLRPSISYRRLFSQLVPSYADAAPSKPGGRPKARTRRATAKKAPAKKKSAATKKKTATRTKAKAKAKATPKPKARKPLSKSAIDRARKTRSRGLKTTALLTEPKQLPANVWSLYVSQNRRPVKSLAEGAQLTKDLAEQFKHLSPEEHEQLNHTANQNKAKNQREYKKWVESHTPTDIKEANNARKLLNKEKKTVEGKKKSSISLIKDDRLVKHPRNAYSFFMSDRFASGDFRKMSIAECAKLAGREWKALSTSEKQPYNDKAAADLARYHEEHKTVYGVEVKTKLKPAA